MAKLHEVLAVEEDLRGAFRGILDETKTTFTKRADHFMGQTRVLEMFEQNHPLHNQEDQQKAMDTTVQAKLEYMADHVIRYLDVVYQKECTNQNANASIEIDGNEIATALPATYLLGLETKLKQLRDVFMLIPTLPPGKDWVPDTTRGENVWTLKEPEQQAKTEKTIKPFVLYEATDKHPAQVEKISDSNDVGMYKRYIWMGMMSPAEKSKLLGRLDKLLQAVKQARQRANTQEAATDQIGAKIVRYLLDG